MSADAAPLALPARLAIGAAAELRATLGARLAAPQLALDGAAVQQADTACLQLLAAFIRDRRDAGRTTAWHASSDALRKSAALLGLASHLALPETAP